MSKPTFKNKKPMQLNISDQHIDVEALDTFEQFCNNIEIPPKQKEQNDGSFLQDSFDEENTVKKQDICIHLSISCSDDEEMNPLYIQSLRLSSPQHEYSFNEHTNESIKFIQFEEFQPGRKSSSKTISQSDSIKSSESFHQNIFIYHMQNKTTACKQTNNNQKISHKENHLPQPTKMQSQDSSSLQKDSNVLKSFIKVKKHLEIEIPEIEDSCSSQEQTLIKQQLNTSETHPEDYKIKLQHLQEELQCLIVSNKLENDNLFNHVQQVTQDNVSLRKEIVDFQVMVDDKDLQIENLLKMNKQLMTEKQIPRDSGDKFKYLQKPELQTIQASPPKVNEKIQYLIGKLNQKSNENSSLQYHISILKNKIEEFQNFYYLENRRELCIEPIEAEFSSPLPKQTPSMSLQSQKGQPDCNTLKHNLSYSSITKEDNIKLQSKKDVGSSAQLLNKIKKKHQTEGLNSGTTQIQTYIKSIKQLEQPQQNTNLLCFRKQKQEKVFSIQTSPQVQKLLTEKPVQSSDVSKSNTNTQLKYDLLEIRNERQNFFYQMTALSRKTSDGIKQEDLSKLSTPNIRLSQNSNLGLFKHNQNSVKDLLEPTRKLSQFSRNTLFNKQERAIQIPPLSNPQFSRSSCDHNIEGGSKHQRNVSCKYFL